MAGPLEGVTVVDVTKVLGPPFCTMILGDMGAEILKVEIPKIGDDFRHSTPIINGESYHFILHNRNKKSITVNLKTKEGKEIVQRLVEKADVFVENQKPGSQKQLGIDYETLSKINPRLVYCSISGYGQSGPLRDYPAYDLIAQAMSGILSVSGNSSGPSVSGVSISDLGSGIYAAMGILAAIIARDRFGVGQFVDVSLLDTSVSVLGQMAALYLGTGRIPSHGDKEKAIVPYGAFETLDRPIALEAAGQATWEKLCRALGKDDWLKDERFATQPLRVKNREALMPKLETELKMRSSEELLDLFKDHGVPSALIMNFKEVFDHPHVKERMVSYVDHQKLGRIRVIGPAVKLSKTPLTVRLPPPLLGEHTDEILERVGYNKADIKRFHEQGIV